VSRLQFCVAPRVRRPRRLICRVGLVTSTVGATVLLSPLPALPAPAGSATLVDNQTVQVQMSASGEVRQARLFTQLTALGHGTIDVLADTSTQGLRNLDGFDSPSVAQGQVRYRLTADGVARRRTVANYDRDLPLAVGVSFKLNGQDVEQGDLAGKAGDLEVRYHISNVSSTPTTITYKNANGGTESETVHVVAPLVGQLAITLPNSVTGVDAPRADLAGDGRGGTKLTWSMVLFEPVGSATQEFGWKAHLNKGGLPAATLTAMPVPPNRKPEFNEKAVQAQAAQTAQLAGGMVQIDSNLLKLANGTGELVDGLHQLADGARKLGNGLSTGAAPGAALLANGMGQAQTGAQQLAEGLHSTHGSPDLAGGTAQLSSGLRAMSNGLTTLAGTSGLGAAYAGAVALRTGVDQLAAGLGSASDPQSILGGLTALTAGSGQLKDGADLLSGGLDALASPTTGLPALKGGLDAVKSGLDAATASGGSIEQLKASVDAAQATAGCADDTTCTSTLTEASAAISGSSTSLMSSTAAASAGLARISGGLGAVAAGIGTGSSPGASTIRGGLALLAGGLGQTSTGLARLTAGLGQVKAGLRSGSNAHPGVSEGIAQLASGLSAAVAGVGQLADGAESASTGSALIADGVSAAGDGAGQLANGLGQLSSGTSQLSSGIAEAGAGAIKIADGTEKAASGGDQIVGGMKAMQSKGTSALAFGLNYGAGQSNRQYALLTALDRKATTSSMPYAAPSGATGSAAYTYELAAVTDHKSQNTLQALGAILIFGIGAGATGVMRRRKRATAS
jgi:putative membrane protein